MAGKDYRTTSSKTAPQKLAPMKPLGSLSDNKSGNKLTNIPAKGMSPSHSPNRKTGR